MSERTDADRRADAPQVDAGLLAELDAMIAVFAARGGPSAGPAAPPKPKILIIEDDGDYSEALCRLLAIAGCEPAAAGDGVEGLSRARLLRPDLIILDFGLPRLNGYEVLRELRSSDELRKTPVLLFTGAPNRGVLRELAPDAQGFLEKPASNERLLGEALRLLGPRAPAAGGSREEAPDLAAVERRKEEALDEAAADAELLRIEREEESREAGALLPEANDSPVVQKVHLLLIRAVREGASDVHIEPLEDRLQIRIRVDGALAELASLPAAISARVAARVKIMADLSVTERRIPQDGQFRASIDGRKIEFRVSTLPSLHGEKVVLRVLGCGKLAGGIEALGLNPRDLAAVERALECPHGLILVTGPTGSGKTTTLYTMLRRLNRPEANILTAEDPVEYRLPGITQTSINAGIGRTFESVLRSFLRQDPDIMLVGEIRDRETAEIAIKASITGHLVLSTLHTNGAAATVSRLVQMGVPSYLVAGSLRLVIAQRLVRALCRGCSREDPSPAETAALLPAPDARRLTSARKGAGCPDCRLTGYAGRLPLFEVLPVCTPELRRLISAAADADALGEQARREGMQPLREAALQAVEQGRTAAAEALKIILSE